MPVGGGRLIARSHRTIWHPLLAQQFPQIVIFEGYLQRSRYTHQSCCISRRYMSASEDQNDWRTDKYIYVSSTRCITLKTCSEPVACHKSEHSLLAGWTGSHPCQYLDPSLLCFFASQCVRVLVCCQSMELYALRMECWDSIWKTLWVMCKTDVAACWLRAAEYMKVSQVLIIFVSMHGKEILSRHQICIIVFN